MRPGLRARVRPGRLVPRRRRPQPARDAEPATDWPGLREALWARCGGLCEACGCGLAGPDRFDAHHRQARGQGGRDVLPCLVALHGPCHTVQPYSVHMRPEWARARGLIVRRGADPARVALLLPDGRLVLLDDAGGYVTVMEREGVAGGGELR